MNTPDRYPEAAIEADPTVPLIRIIRDFRATVEQLMKAHTDPELVVRWLGPDAARMTIIEWNAVPGGSWKWSDRQHVFRGCFHDVQPGRIVQTFTWEGIPDQVALETLTLVDIGGGITRLTGESLTDSFEKRDGWLRSGMETGVNEGYAKLDALLAQGAV